MVLASPAVGSISQKEEDDAETEGRFFSYDVEQLRPIYESWTPHRMLPRWTPSAFPLYIERCEGFRDAILTLMLCLRRYRHMVAREVGMDIVSYVAEMHRKEMWWPAWKDFDMRAYM